MDEESDGIFGDVVKQMSISKSFPTKIKFCVIHKRSSIKIPKDFNKLDIVIISKENRFSVDYTN